MILIKEGTIEKIQNWKNEDIYILIDFDKTITSAQSISCWTSLLKSRKVPKEYIDERQKLYDYYKPIEMDEEMNQITKKELMTECWSQYINLLIKYKMKEEVIKDVATNLNIMRFRSGAKEFLKEMQKRNIPIVIISAGIGNLIREVLINNDCNFNNIHIISNFIEFKYGIAIGKIGNIVHSANKSEVILSNDIKTLLSQKKFAILIGDQISDTLMLNEEIRDNALKIGFLDKKVENKLVDYKKHFDIICTDNTSYIEILDKLNI